MRFHQSLARSGQCSSLVESAQYQTRRVRPDHLILALLVFAVLAMPVNYRAGTGRAHAHTIFQGMIDALVGHPHHDTAGDGDLTFPLELTSGAVSPFLAASIPLNVAFKEAGTVTTTYILAPDIPSMLGLNSPIEGSSAIAALGALIALLLANIAITPGWARVKRLLTIVLSADTPPPRPA